MFVPVCGICMYERQTDGRTDGQTDRLTDRQANTETDRKTNKHKNRHILTKEPLTHLTDTVQVRTFGLQTGFLQVCVQGRLLLPGSTRAPCEEQYERKRKVKAWLDQTCARAQARTHSRALASTHARTRVCVCVCVWLERERAHTRAR